MKWYSLRMVTDAMGLPFHTAAMMRQKIRIDYGFPDRKEILTLAGGKRQSCFVYTKEQYDYILQKEKERVKRTSKLIKLKDYDGLTTQSILNKFRKAGKELQLMPSATMLNSGKIPRGLTEEDVAYLRGKEAPDNLYSANQAKDIFNISAPYAQTLFRKLGFPGERGQRHHKDVLLYPEEAMQAVGTYLEEYKTKSQTTDERRLKEAEKQQKFLKKRFPEIAANRDQGLYHRIQNNYVRFDYAG